MRQMRAYKTMRVHSTHVSFGGLLEERVGDRQNGEKGIVVFLNTTKIVMIQNCDAEQQQSSGFSFNYILK